MTGQFADWNNATRHRGNFTISRLVPASHNFTPFFGVHSYFTPVMR